MEELPGIGGSIDLPPPQTGGGAVSPGDGAAFEDAMDAAGGNQPQDAQAIRDDIETLLDGFVDQGALAPGEADFIRNAARLAQDDGNVPALQALLPIIVSIASGETSFNQAFNTGLADGPSNEQITDLLEALLEGTLSFAAQFAFEIISEMDEEDVGVPPLPGD